MIISDTHGFVFVATTRTGSTSIEKYLNPYRSAYKIKPIAGPYNTHCSLEKIYSKDYSEILLDKIIKPLRLNSTYYGGVIDINDNEARSYIYAGKWIKQDETDPSVPLGAGGIVSNPIDLVKFSYLLFNGKILKEESLKKMKKMNGQFALGLFGIPFYNKNGFGHTGGIDGFSSVFSAFT